MRRRYVVIVLIGTLTAVVLNVLLYRQSDAIFSTLNELSESLNKKERERFEVQLFLTQLHKSNSVQQTFENFQKSTFFVNRQQEITDPTLLDNWPEYHTLKQSNQTIDDLRADFLHTVNRSGQASFAATDFVAWGGQAIRVLETNQQLLITLRHYLKKLNEEQLLKVVSYNVVALLTLLILLLVVYWRQPRELLVTQRQLNGQLEEKNQRLQHTQRQMVSILDDVRMEKERALSMAEENFRLAMIVQQAPDAVFQLSPDFKIVEYNQVAAELFHRAGMQLMHMQFLDLFAGDNNHRCQAALAAVDSNQQMATFEVSTLVNSNQNNGTHHEVILHPLLSETNDLLGIAATIRDISSRYQEREQLRMIIEQAPNALIMVDASGKISVSNEQADVMFDYTDVSLVGESIDQLVPDTVQASHPQLRCSFLEQPRARAMGAGRDLTAKRKDGSEIPVEIDLNPVSTSQGKFVVVSIVDVSERQRQEKTLRDMNLALTQKNKEMEQFVYTVSHDLKSPLVTIAGFSQKLKQDLGATLSDRQSHKLDRIVANVSHMEGLLADLLQLSRVIRKTVERTPLDVASIVEHAVALSEISLQRANGQIIFKTPLDEIFANEALLKQCVQNLIDNTINYRDRFRSLRITVSTEKREGWMLLHINDNGLGIEQKYHQQIFRIFERLTVGEGSGVGLAIVKTVMDKHDGYVTLESEPGVGSTFTLHFPHNCALSHLPLTATAHG